MAGQRSKHCAQKPRMEQQQQQQQQLRTIAADNSAHEFLRTSDRSVPDETQGPRASTSASAWPQWARCSISLAVLIRWLPFGPACTCTATMPPLHHVICLLHHACRCRIPWIRNITSAHTVPMAAGTGPPPSFQMRLTSAKSRRTTCRWGVSSPETVDAFWHGLPLPACRVGRAHTASLVFVPQC